MKISANIKVNEENFLQNNNGERASGWVEIEDCIKFPVKVRIYTDRDGKEKLFVAYPKKPSKDGYEGIVYPHDRKAREEVQACILEEMKQSLLKGVSTPPVTDVRVTVLERTETDRPVALRGLATIKVAGFTIKGIMVKESHKKGLFVQMPQYQSNGEHKDVVYGTSRLMQSKIRDEVLYAYEKELGKRRRQEPVPHGAKDQAEMPDTRENAMEERAGRETYRKPPADSPKTPRM